MKSALLPDRTMRPGWMGLAAVGLMFCGMHSARAELSFAPSWQLPTYEAVRGQMLDWIEAGRFQQPLEDRLKADWPRVALRATDGGSLLRRLAETFAEADPRAVQLVDHCNRPQVPPTLADAAWLRGTEVSPWMRSNLQLYYARWLVQQAFYDEALAELEGITPADVVDPAALHFCRMVAHHQLVQPDRSRAALTLLLEHEEALPLRYGQLSQLVKRDLSALEDDSLDHIARRMNDVRRRLVFGRTGDEVQMVERGVVQSLDKLIKKIEEEQKQRSVATGGGGGTRPMQDSMPGELKAPGRVDPRDIGHKSGWGDLPPKEREQALQQIGREFPAYYREMIEQYFRDLANENND